jgi:hypothetical protein
MLEHCGVVHITFASDAADRNFRACGEGAFYDIRTMGGCKDLPSNPSGLTG